MTNESGRALSEFVFSVLQEGRSGNEGLFRGRLLHKNHKNGLISNRFDIDGDVQRVLASAGEHTTDWGDV